MQFNALSYFSFPPGRYQGYTHASKFLSNLMCPIFQPSSYIIFDSVKSWIYVFFCEDLHLADTNYNGSLSIFRRRLMQIMSRSITQHHSCKLIFKHTRVKQEKTRNKRNGDRNSDSKVTATP